MACLAHFACKNTAFAELFGGSQGLLQLLHLTFGEAAGRAGEADDVEDVVESHELPHLDLRLRFCKFLTTLELKTFENRLKIARKALENNGKQCQSHRFPFRNVAISCVPWVSWVPHVSQQGAHLAADQQRPEQACRLMLF